MSELQDLRRTVPLLNIVNAAILDMHEDIGKSQQTYLHWAARGLKKLSRETLRLGMRKVTITVNRSTNTATLPEDFTEEHGLFVIVCDKKVPLRPNSSLVDTKGIQDIACEDKCPRCAQDTSLCNDLTITESTRLVQIGNQTGTETTIKKLYPNGEYFLEVTYPVLDIGSQTIRYVTAKDFITTLDMKPCGCVDLTPATVEKIRCCCPDVFCNHIMDCDCNCTEDFGTYNIFEETGLIQFDKVGQFKKVYLEYWGFIPKKHGQYHVPEIAYETLTEFTKYKAIQNKRGMTRWERQDQFESYRRERKNMEKIMGRVSLSYILDLIHGIPKFDIVIPCTDDCPCTESKIVEIAATATDDCGASSDDVTPIQNTEDMSCCTFRTEWLTTGTEGTVLQSNEIKNRRMLVFNIENNSLWKFITEGIPDEQQILYDAQAGTLTFLHAIDPDQRAYALYADKLS